MKRSFAFVLLVATSVGASGCLFSRSVINGPEMRQRIGSVEAGRTTAADLERILGTPPTSITPVGSGRVYAWSFGDAKTAGLNLVLININKTNLGIDTALFLVDAQDVVQQISVGKNSEQLPWEWWAFGD